MTVYDFKLEVVWVRKAIYYQSNKVYSEASASLRILQMVRIEFDSFFRALSLHWFLSNWFIWWFTRFTPFPFTIITPSIWYWVPFSLFVYTFWALITRVLKPVNTTPTAPLRISCRITYMSNSWAVKRTPVTKEHCLCPKSNACSPCTTRRAQEAMLAAKTFFWYIWYLL